MQAFDDDRRDEASLLEGAAGIRSGQGWCKVFRIGLAEAMVQIKLFEGRFDDCACKSTFNPYHQQTCGIATHWQLNTDRNTTHTRSVVCIREIRAIGRTRFKSTPKSAAAQSSLESRNVGVLLQAAVLKLVFEAVAVDMIAIESAEDNEEIIVAIC